MPELRKDPIVGRWVIISTDRAKRPTDFAREGVKIKGGFCPFCYGNENKTPPEIHAYRPNPKGGPPPQRDTPGWTVRVVPNKFPALGIEGNLNRQAEGMFDKMNGIGEHEVIIETPDHNATLATLPPKRIEDVLWTFTDRILDLKKDRRFKYILIFKNHGEAAGASLEHAHSQLIALTMLPIYRTAEVDKDGGIRMGNEILHQSHASIGSGEISPGSECGGASAGSGWVGKFRVCSLRRSAMSRALIRLPLALRTIHELRMPCHLDRFQLAITGFLRVVFKI